MADIESLSGTDASNTARFPENQLPSTVNDGARALEGMVARWFKDTNGSVSTTGSSNTYAFAANRTQATVYAGEAITFKANHTNTGASTINITPSGGSARGTKALQKNGAALAANDIISGGVYTIVYDGTRYQVLNSAVVIGTNVQAYDAGLAALAGLAVSDGNVAVGNGSTWVAESAATLRTSVGVGTGDSPQFTNVTLTGYGYRSITNSITAGSTQSQAGATALTTELNRVTTVGTNGDGVKLPTAVAGARITIVNDDSAQNIKIWPNTSDAIDGGSANAVDANTLAAGSSRTYIAVDATNWYTENIAIVSPTPVANGGTGATSLTDGGILLGSGTDAVTVMSVLADSEMIVGDGSTDPVAESGATLRTSVGVGTGDSPQFTNLTLTGHTQRSLATGITAGTTQTMAGATALTKDINIVTVNGNDDDGVALPTAVAGKEVTIINSDAAQRLQVWPGNGFSDTIDGGSANAVDANKLAAGGVRTYTADGATNWVTATNPAISTPVSVANGGTGATSLTDGGVLLGSGTNAVTAMGVLADSTMIVGDGSTDPVAESGATLRTSIGVGTGDTPEFTGVNLGGTALNDYVVGTWTPALNAASGSGTIAYDTQDGTYTRIGNQVFLRFELHTNDIASRTGAIEGLTGLPITSVSSPTLMSGGGAASHWGNFDMTAAGEGIYLWVEDGTTNMKVYSNNTVSTLAELPMSEWTDDGRLWGSLVYEV